METTTLILKTKSLVKTKLSVLALLCLGANSASAQVQTFGNVYIGNGAEMYLSSNMPLGFNPGFIVTDRTASTFGKLSFAAAPGWDGTSANSGAFIDGYNRTYAIGTTTFPVGNGTQYAPAKVITTTANAVDTAFLVAAPVNGTTAYDNTTIQKVSTHEYWNIKAVATNPSKLSLSWSAASNLASDLSMTATTLPLLTIVGYNGVSWVKITSTLDAASMVGGAAPTPTLGSISSTGNIDLANFTAFALAFGKEVCAPIVAASNSSTWNGSSWSAGTPTEITAVTLTGNYPTGNPSFTCNSLALGAFNVTIDDGNYVEVVKSVTGSGIINIGTAGSFVQRDGTATAPNILLTKTSRFMKKFDYVYWGSPIAGNYYAQLANARVNGGDGTVAFDRYYRYNSGAGGAWQAFTTATDGSPYFARTFITRIKAQAIFATTTTTASITLPFSGVANNGDLTVAAIQDAGNTTGPTSFNLYGNPYPSSIDATMFVRDNAALNGAIYYWTSGTVNAGQNQIYNHSDYGTWTIAGAVGTGSAAGTGGPAPTGLISTGQGFQLLANSNGSAVFTNCMRTLNNSASNAVFFRNAQTVATPQIDRYSITITKADNSVYSEALVAYLPEATYGVDRLYDAFRNSVSETKIYSLIDGAKYGINGRPTFDSSDIVPIGYTKTATGSEDFIISLKQNEGAFLDSNINIYLHDKTLETYTDLKAGNYTFSTSVAEDNARFELVYQTVLKTNQVANQSVFMNLQNNNFMLNASDAVSNVKIFDLVGRQIENYNAKENKTLNEKFFHEEGVYIARVTLANGSIVSQKLINRK